MGRILEGLKGFPVPPIGGGWGVFLPFPSFRPRCGGFVSLSPVLWGFPSVLLRAAFPSSCGQIFIRSRSGFSNVAQICPLMPVYLACGAVSLVGRGFGWVESFWGLVGLEIGCYINRLRTSSTYKRERATKTLFCPCSCSCLCSLPCVLCVCCSLYRKKKRPFYGSFLLVWWLVSPCLTYRKDSKRCGLLTVYLYVCCGGLHSAGRWACDIIEVGSICGLGACLTVVNSCGFHGVFLLLIYYQY